MGKIALVTGANKGIGLETSRQLARAGVKVILGARDAHKAEGAATALKGEGLDAEPVVLDVTHAASIAAAFREVSARHARLDILVNNAGVSLGSPSTKVSAVSLDTWRQTFETNLFGVIAVTQAFLPLLLNSPAGRIVNLSSILGSITLHADPKSTIYHYKVAAYNVSKSALNAYTVQLAYELRESNIKVNAVHPGHVKTDMGGATAALEVTDGAQSSVSMALIGADGPNGTFSHLGKPLPW